MSAIYTEIEINASAEKVWTILTEIEKYSEWNPFIVKGSGKAELGSKLNNVIINDGKEFTFKPTVTKSTPGKEFEWLGHLFFPGLFDGRHYFQIEKRGEGKVLLRHGERFKGILKGIILSKIKEDTQKGFESMNKALKERAES